MDFGLANGLPDSAPPMATEQSSFKESLFSTKNLVAIAVGTALYAALTIPFNSLQLPGLYLVTVRPTVAIPVVFGLLFGPLAGFVSGFLGNIISDQVSFGGFFWNWDIGNGLIGLVPAAGYYMVKKTDFTKARGLTTTVVLAIVGAVIGIGFAAVTDLVFQIGLSTTDAAIAEFIPPALTDAVNGAILAPIIIYAYISASAGRARRM